MSISGAILCRMMHQHDVTLRQRSLIRALPYILVIKILQMPWQSLLISQLASLTVLRVVVGSIDLFNLLLEGLRLLFRGRGRRYKLRIFFSNSLALKLSGFYALPL